MAKRKATVGEGKKDDSNSNVVVWGAATGGEDVLTPHRLPLPGGFKAKAVYSGCCASVSFAVDHNGMSLFWGSGDAGGANIPALPTPLKVKDPVAVASAGKSHFAFVTMAGELFTWGKGDHGQLGHGSEVSKSTPTRVHKLSTVKSVACGEDFTVALDSDGCIHTCGYPEAGIIGDDHCSDHMSIEGRREVYSPVVSFYKVNKFVTKTGSAGITEVLSSDNIKFASIACGQRHVVALESKECASSSNMTNPRIYAWGSSDKLQLGFGSNTKERLPRRLDGLARFSIGTIGCGATCTYAITEENGVCFYWGKHRVTSGDSGLSRYPTPLLNEFEVTSAAIGKTVAVIGALSRVKNDDGSIDVDTIIWGGGGGGEIRGCLGQLKNDVPGQPLKSVPEENYLMAMKGLHTIQYAMGSYHVLCIVDDTMTDAMKLLNGLPQLDTQNAVQGDGGKKTKPKRKQGRKK